MRFHLVRTYIEVTSMLAFVRPILALFLVVLAVLCTLGFLSATEVVDPIGRRIVRVLGAVLVIGSSIAAAWLLWPKQGDRV
jgi:hypothetical protein